MDMQTIEEFKKQKKSEIAGEIVHLPWVFDKWYEKLILAVLTITGFFNVIKFLGGFIV